MRRTITAWSVVVVAVLVWSGFGFLVWQLGESRIQLSARHMESKAQEERSKSAAALQTLMRETKEQRAVLNGVIQTDALAAAATIEAAGRKAGLTVSIQGATTVNVQGAQAADVRAVTLVASTEGEFTSLMRAAEIFESLPFPSRIESYEMTALEPTKTRKDPWRLTARIYALIPSESQ